MKLTSAIPKSSEVRQSDASEAFVVDGNSLSSSFSSYLVQWDPILVPCPSPPSSRVMVPSSLAPHMVSPISHGPGPIYFTYAWNKNSSPPFTESMLCMCALVTSKREYHVFNSPLGNHGSRADLTLPAVISSKYPPRPGWVTNRGWTVIRRPPWGLGWLNHESLPYLIKAWYGTIRLIARALGP